MIKKIWTYIKGVVSHKLHFWGIKSLKSKLLKWGLPLLIIFIAWEIFEDIIFPYMCYLLGEHVHKGFYTLIPVAWLACMHPIAVPVIFWLYIKITGKQIKDKNHKH